MGSTLSSEKAPFENRIWYVYFGWDASRPWEGGTTNQPTQAIQFVGNSFKTTMFAYNATRLIQVTDPLLRNTYFDYDAATNTDLITIRQGSAGVKKMVYDPTFPPHSPKTVYDASGEPTNFTYDALGRVLTSKNAKNETTTSSYTRTLSTDGPADGTCIR